MVKRWARDAIKQAFPEAEVVETPATNADSPSLMPKPERPGASIDELRAKFLGPDAAATPESSADAEDADDEVEVARIRPKQSPADPVDDLGPKTVITSKNRGPLGSQG